MKRAKSIQFRVLSYIILTLSLVFCNLYNLIESNFDLAYADGAQLQNTVQSITQTFTPQNVCAYAEPNGTNLISWDSKEQENTWNVYRSTSPGFTISPDNRLNTCTSDGQGITKSFWEDSTGISGTTYYYKVTTIIKTVKTETDDNSLNCDNTENQDFVESKSSPAVSVTCVDANELDKRVGMKSYWRYSDFKASNGTGNVNVSSGNLVFQNEDFSFPSLMPMTMTRTYNSQSTATTVLGKGWNFSFDIALLTMVNGDILLKNGDGTLYKFIHSTNDGRTSYTPEPGLFMALEHLTDGTWQITRKDNIKYQFGSNMLLTKMIDLNGNYLDYAYNDRGSIICVSSSAGDVVSLDYYTDADGNGLTGLMKTVTDPSGRACTYLYNSARQLISRTFADNSGTQYIEQFAYESNTGFLRGITDEKGNQTIIEYSGNRVTKVDEPSPDAAQPQYITYTYDDDDHMTIVANQSNQSTGYTYDINGLILSETDSQNNTTDFTYNWSNFLVTNKSNNNLYDGKERLSIWKYEYDSNGNLDQMIDPTGHYTTYEYNNYNKVTAKHVKGADNKSDDAVTQYTYDAKGNLLSETDPAGRFISFTYFPNGKVQTKTDSYNNTTTYTYGDHGWLVHEQYGQDTNDCYDYGYDTLGNIVDMKDHIRNTETGYSYGIDNRITGVSEGTLDFSSVLHQYAIAYNDKGNVETVTEIVNGQTTETTYAVDSNNSLSTMQLKTNGTTSPGVAWSYDDDGYLKAIDVSENNKEILGTTYTYADPLAYSPAPLLMNQIKGTGETGYNQTLVYTCDKEGNLASIGKGVNITSYAYDSKHQVIRENNAAANKTWTWSYDGNGNIATKDEYAYTTGSLGTPKSTILFQHAEVKGMANVITSIDGAAISYDNYNNPLADGTWTYSWDAGGHLVGLNKDGAVISYTYNKDGQRTGKTINGVQTNYTLIDGRVTSAITGREDICFRYDASGKLISMNLDGNEYYYMKNAQGDIIGLSDRTGAAIVVYTYDAFGRVLSSSGPMAKTVGEKNLFRYREYWYDTQSKLYFIQNRYYNPVWGRFINAGYELTDLQTSNPYLLSDTERTHLLGTLQSVIVNPSVEPVTVDISTTKPPAAPDTTDISTTTNQSLALTQKQINEIMKTLPEGLDDKRVKLVLAAYSLVGKVDYFWGGKSYAIGWDNRWGTPMVVTTPGNFTTGTTRSFGLDCSGFTAWVFLNSGIMPKKTLASSFGIGSANQWNHSVAIDWSDIQVGDLVFLAIPGTVKVNHVGVCVGFNKAGKPLIAESPCTGKKVKVIVLSPEFKYVRRPNVLLNK